jgi:hypothetical protein
VAWNEFVNENSRENKSLELSALLRHGTVLPKRLMWGFYGASLRDVLAMPRSSIDIESDPQKVSLGLLDIKYFFMGRTKFPKRPKGILQIRRAKKWDSVPRGTRHSVHMAFLTREMSVIKLDREPLGRIFPTVYSEKGKFEGTDAASTLLQGVEPSRSIALCSRAGRISTEISGHV